MEVIRERLTRLLLIKDKQEELEDQSKVFIEKIEKQKIQEKSFDDELDEIDRQMLLCRRLNMSLVLSQDSPCFCITQTSLFSSVSVMNKN